MQASDLRSRVVTEFRESTVVVATGDGNRSHVQRSIFVFVSLQVSTSFSKKNSGHLNVLKQGC